MKRLIAIATLLFGLFAVGAYLMRDQIALALFERGMEQVLTTDPFAGRPDGLGVALCGAGSPMPSPDRAGPCTVITAGRHVYLVDIGEGGVRNLGRMGYGAGRVEAVFLTHFHSDHIDSLGALMLQHWGTSGSPVPLPGCTTPTTSAGSTASPSTSSIATCRRRTCCCLTRAR